MFVGRGYYWLMMVRQLILIASCLCCVYTKLGIAEKIKQNPQNRFDDCIMGALGLKGRTDVHGF